MVVDRPMKAAGASPSRRRRVLTVREISDHLRISTATVRRLLARGDLPAFRVGKGWRFELTAIEDWCSRSTIKPTAEKSTSNGKDCGRV